MFGKNDVDSAESSEALAEELKEAGYERVELHVVANYAFNEYSKGDELYIADTAENRARIAGGNFSEVKK